MIRLLDSSVLVAALAPDEERHRECLDLLRQGGHVVWTHAFLETFAALTGGRLGIRVDADLASRLLKETVRPRVHVVEIGIDDLLSALAEAKRRGVRGGAVYDYLHLMAAKQAGASVVATLNVSDFVPLQRPGDPEIECP
jgi:predicted nucleic acid-binding protein